MWNLWKYGNRPALKDNYGHMLTYNDIRSIAKVIKSRYGTRNLVYFRATNDIWSIANYIALLQTKQTIILVDDKVKEEYHNHYKKIFFPNMVFEQNQLTLRNGLMPWVNPKLALLLPTSGSTGDSKFVRISYKNIKANIKSVLDFLPIDKNERPILSLPMSYVFGLSVINSHIAAGACIYVTDQPCYSKQFWQFANENKCTSFSNVSAAYEMMLKFGFPVSDSMKYFSHSGGRLSDRTITKINELCKKHNIDFYRMYGTTECMSRMTYLPPNESDAPSGCVGRSVKNGKIKIVDGKIVYSGPNVAMGYASCYHQLLLDDYWNGIFESGDIGYIDETGALHIQGRESRFTKQHGYRYSLDNLENLIETHWNCECMIKIRYDDFLVIGTTENIPQKELIQWLRENNYLIGECLVQWYPELPHNLNGKKDYKNFDKQEES